MNSYVTNGGSVLLPPGIGDVHHEVELGVGDNALSYVYSYVYSVMVY